MKEGFTTSYLFLWIVVYEKVAIINRVKIESIDDCEIWLV